ncbi:MAG: TIGR03936 family radical SAM-associated protein [Planctomycetes bacterium]|nr:TIGR03936 family radical SAM-associated protein [Planctomycetota bacterium]
MTASRYRMRFEKREALRFISHHDLMRVFELALRRSGLKVAHTQGFNPHPKVSFALALPLGVESLDEIVDIDIEHEGEPPAPNDVVSQLAAVMPEGLRLLSAEISEGRPRVTAIEYECELPPDYAELTELQARLDAFLSSSTHPFTRERGKGKAPRSFDARAHTDGARLDGRVLKMRLLFGPEGGMKPSDLLQILQLDPNRHLVTKTKTILAELLDTTDAESSN